MKYYSMKIGDVTAFAHAETPPEDATIYEDEEAWHTAVENYRNNPPVLGSLDEIKQAATRTIIASANAFTAPLLAKYPQAEKEGWPARLAEANLILAADDKSAAIAQTTIIKALASAHNETEEETLDRANSIVTKATEFATISAMVEIMRDQALTAINAVDNREDMKPVLDGLAEQALALAKQYGLA